LLNLNLPDLPPSSSAVFVTGATGFIGRHLVSTLNEQGHAVCALIRPGKQSDDRLPAECTQVPVGLTDVNRLADIVANSSAVIYCAGSVRGSSYADFSEANIAGVKAILDAIERVEDAPPLLLISSLAASRPQLSDYSRSKHEAENLLKGKSLLSWTIFRPPAIYGPGDKEMLPLLKMARQGLVLHAGSRDQRLSMLHVGDLVKAIAAWLKRSQQCLHKTYAIDDGKPGGYSWDDFGEVVSSGRYQLLKLPRLLLAATAQINLLSANIFRYQPMLTPGKVQELTQPDWLCHDNQQFYIDSGWEPAYDLKRGVQQLFKDSFE